LVKSLDELKISKSGEYIGKILRVLKQPVAELISGKSD
jgi:hypothetical protein